MTEELMGELKKSSGTQEGVVAEHGIAAKMCKSHLAYKVKVHAWLAWLHMEDCF